MSALQIYGEPDEALLARQIELAFGKVREDRRWINQTCTVRDLINGELSDFAHGPKNGRCFLQGPVSKSGGERKKNGIPTCYLMMLDHDTGLSMDDVHGQIDAKSLFAVLWHTHSHLKPESTIAETKLTQFMAKQGVTKVDTDVCRAYFRERKLEPYILDSMRYEGRRLGDNGAEIFVSHAPMHRVRSLFILAQPYSFLRDDCSQVEAIRQWNELYAGVSTELGLPFDSSCVDPSRLMYLPRIAPEADASQYEIRLVAGAPLDLAQVKRLAITSHKQPVASRTAPLIRHNELASRFANAGPSGAAPATEFQTPWLRSFLAKYGHDFEAADFLQSIAPEDVRPGGPSNGINFACPNEDGHSVQSATDAAFMATNAEVGVSAWTMFCHHDSCKSASQGDRGWYLDRALQKYGVTDAGALKSFSATGRAEATQQTVAAEAQAVGRDEAALTARIEALTGETHRGEIEEILRALATRQDGDLFVADAIDTIATKTDRRRPDLKRRITALRRGMETLARIAAGDGDDEGGGPITHPVPENLAEAPVIWMDWPSKVRNEAALKRLEYLNKQGEPQVFRAMNGGNVALIETATGFTVAEMTAENWHHTMVSQLDVRVLRADGSEDSIDPPVGFRIFVQGAKKPDFPMLRGILRVPVFGPDGTLRTRRGYDHDLQMVLVPDLEFYDVPVRPSEDDVTCALNWLSEAVRDFPFTDSFDGQDPHAIKLAEKDADGWQLPNPERGKASFANFIALVLQPFARSMIGDSPCPFYHIDKASPGTGAGYLVDVATCIAEGSRASISTLARNLDEIQKTITAHLRSGDMTIFFDNVNHKVDSGDLAAMATSGKWKARILGVSDTCEVPVRQRVIFAGNNLEFSGEMMRRNVPIRLDANCPNPAIDRGADAFKHNPLQEWVLSHRRELVWACHVLIQNWVAGGMKRGGAVMNSFDRWASTMSGILEECGVEAFLASTPEYLAVRNDDVSTEEEFAQKIFDEFRYERADTVSILDIVRDPSGAIGFDLPIDPQAKPPKQLGDMGKILKKMAARTFHVNPAAPPKGPFKGVREGEEGGEVTLPTPSRTSVKLIRTKAKGHVYWRFQRVLTNEDDVG